MSDKPLTVKQRVAQGQARAACPLCRWTGEWRDITYAGGRSIVGYELEQHLVAVHGRKPLPR